MILVLIFEDIPYNSIEDSKCPSGQYQELPATAKVFVPPARCAMHLSKPWRYSLGKAGLVIYMQSSCI